jgi:hypothetical protein
MHFGENQLSPGSLGISPLTAAHPDFLQQVSVRPSTGVFRPLQPGHGEITRFRVGPGRLRALLGLAFAAAPPVPGLASPPRPTRRLILQKARRHLRRLAPARLRPAGSTGFQDLFHSPRRGAFHRSLTVLVRYRSPAVFSLGAWSPPLQPGCRVSGPTHDSWSLGRLGPLPTGLSPPAGPRSSGLRLVPCPQRGRCRRLHQDRPTPCGHRRQAVPPPRFGLLPLRSPLLRESSLLLGVLRCFSSPGAPSRVTPGVPGRAPGGLPHSETPGSPAASASPGHIAAWPRPSSAANT